MSSTPHTPKYPGANTDITWKSRSVVLKRLRETYTPKNESTDMNYNLSSFFDFVAQELTGDIHPGGERMLHRIISADPWAAKEYAKEYVCHRSRHKVTVAAVNLYYHALDVIADAERKAQRSRMLITRAAAAVLVLIISGFCYFHYGPPTFGGKNPMLVFSFGSREDSATRTVVTLRGKEDSVSLADGSTVRLNAASRLQTHFSKDNRKVDFRGEAYFRVAPGRRPFIVNTPYASPLRYWAPSSMLIPMIPG